VLVEFVSSKQQKQMNRYNNYYIIHKQITSSSTTTTIKPSSTIKPPPTSYKQFTTTIITKKITPSQTTTTIATRKEALSLYRDVLRTARAFYWPRESDGVQWSKILKESARKEFEQSKNERDPIIIARLLVVGRQSLEILQNKFNEMENQIKNRVNNTRIR
jgi:hypothetical protein